MAYTQCPFVLLVDAFSNASVYVPSGAIENPGYAVLNLPEGKHSLTTHDSWQAERSISSASASFQFLAEQDRMPFEGATSSLCLLIFSHVHQARTGSAFAVIHVALL